MFIVATRTEEDRRGGGVLIAIRDNMSSLRRRDIETNCELVVAEVNPTKANKFLLYGFYRPPSTNSEYLLELKQSLSHEELNTPLFLCGDFNFPDIHWNFEAAPGLDNLPNMFCDIVSVTFLTQMNHSTTRITDNAENILDLVFTNQPERVCEMETFDCQFATDHLELAFLIKTKVKRERLVRYSYDFKKANFDALRQALSVTSLDLGFDESDVDQGVPQGSLLGPALFVLFINDMPSALSHSSTLALFADDAKCFRTIRSYADCALLQDEIDKLVDWSNNWKLAFNVDKCSLCTVTRKRSPIICNYRMGEKALSRVRAQRDLGVLMSDTASFNDHIQAQMRD
ncbi:putative RNA-directed DNA polymerase from transposon X-element [Stylophora pistillata]|uniref:Putative RNA-directed DNA polymerase from transposon X-element n=1 Tax=Stylophora pistillata TaxID=50429 RepID=A0A2B4RC54_STYPI|nr:putative RNA-directed DNA polymerase from transposon X-element [Stylophora pistillata]